MAWSRFVLSALGVSIALHVGLEDPWLGALLLVCVALVAIPQYRARQRLRELLSSGDLETILDIWEEGADAHPHHRTTAALARATALVAHGLTERADDTLNRAAGGKFWDQVIEHRLFVEVLVEAFEGRPEQALEKAHSLCALPLPASPWVRGRAAVLRQSAEALARAFGHCAQPKDLRRLAAAARHHPLVHWAMRYAQAVVQIDNGNQDRALRLISNAPKWPENSVFGAFQLELTTVAQRTSKDTNSPETNLPETEPPSDKL